MRFLPCGCEPAGVLRCDRHYDAEREREVWRRFMQQVQTAKAAVMALADDLPDEPGDEIVVVTPENCEHSCVAVCFGCR